MIYRNQSDIFYPITTPQQVQRAPYPWESDSNLPRITKEFFRCKGSLLHAPVMIMNEASQVAPCADCEGGSRHGLPVIAGREGVYSVLLDLLNFVQKKTGRRVIITSGHRCPAHNIYVDGSKENRVSKHQIGAEVNFYVQGMEERPLEVIGLLMQYYQEKEECQNQKEYQNFTRYDKPDIDVATQPWMNKEIYIKLYQKNEGRNFDNRHPHAYIDVQVRFDRNRNERVVYDWQKANQGYSRGW